MEEGCESLCSKVSDNDTGIRLVSIVYDYNGLGMKLCRNSWDPYPFISHVAENSPAHLAAVKIGDCILKVKIVIKVSGNSLKRNIIKHYKR